MTTDANGDAHDRRGRYTTKSNRRPSKSLIAAAKSDYESSMAELNGLLDELRGKFPGCEISGSHEGFYVRTGPGRGMTQAMSYHWVHPDGTVTHRVAAGEFSSADELPNDEKHWQARHIAKTVEQNYDKALQAAIVVDKSAEARRLYLEHGL